MSNQHGSKTVVLLSSIDLSAYTNNTAFNRKADTHDNTCYGASAHTYGAGLTDGTVTISGKYDTAASSVPSTVIPPLLGSSITYAFKFRSEGTGSGKAQRACDVIVAEYVETSPVADYVSWSAQLQITGAVTDTDQ